MTNIERVELINGLKTLKKAASEHLHTMEGLDHFEHLEDYVDLNKKTKASLTYVMDEVRPLLD